jgi:hypothetical protein
MHDTCDFQLTIYFLMNFRNAYFIYSPLILTVLIWLPIIIRLASIATHKKLRNNSWKP